ncbi:uncharacterized protein LOC117333342 [Pecten maximus]|uniref:uncharacterized protein LOC117333342 n=1 Tax=Pecten maximus TaxID=6579 RepID=UPI001458D824|nr:uncharacterized protein LOC117333342 [Pecten maximus]XP_033748501.1 uncharacterized protein LOC117333342 [Pecten maximus]
MAEVTSYLKAILENQKQIQDATRSNSVNIARIGGEFTTTLGSIKTLLHVLNHRIENNIFSPSVSRHHRSHPGPTRTDGDGDVSGTEGIHRECLQEHLEYIVKQLAIDGTTLIDELQEDSCLTEGEASDIRYQKDTKTRIRKLIYAIYTRDRQTFAKFMKRLQGENTHVHEKIQKAYSTKLDEGPRSSECLICVIKRDVDIRRVADKLCSHFIIDMEYLNTFLSYSDHSLPKVRKEFWKYVFSQIDQSSKRDEQILQLRNALADSKYNGLADKLQSWSRKELSCHCNLFPTLSIQTNFADSYSTCTTSTGDLSTTSNIRSKSQMSLQSVSSLDEDVGSECMPYGGNMPYTVESLNSSPATNFKHDPWEYPESKKQMKYSQPINTALDSRHARPDNTGKENESSFSLKSIADALNARESEHEILPRSNRAIEKSDTTPRGPLDMSTDEQESSLKPRRLELDVAVANELKQIIEPITTPLPTVDVYTGRKKVYKKKRHTRTRSDDSSKIRFDRDLHISGDQDRLRLINGLLDTPERGISDIFYNSINNIRPKSAYSDQDAGIASGDKSDNVIKSETNVQSNPDNIIPVTTTNCVEVLKQTSKTETAVSLYRLRSPDGNNNPKYVTDQIIMTPSRHLDPLSSGLGTRSDNTSSRKWRRNGKWQQNKSHRNRFDTC